MFSCILDVRLRSHICLFLFLSSLIVKFVKCKIIRRKSKWINKPIVVKSLQTYSHHIIVWKNTIEWKKLQFVQMMFVKNINMKRALEFNIIVEIYQHQTNCRIFNFLLLCNLKLTSFRNRVNCNNKWWFLRITQKQKFYFESSKLPSPWTFFYCQC